MRQLVSIALRSTNTEIEAQAFQKLTAVREIKKSGIERYFNTIRDQVLTLSEDTMIIDAMKEFTVAMKSFREENNLSDENVAALGKELRTYYTGQFAPEYEKQNDGAKPDIDGIFTKLDKDSLALQYHYIQANRHPLGEKHLLDAAGGRLGLFEGPTRNITLRSAVSWRNSAITTSSWSSHKQETSSIRFSKSSITPRH